MAGTKSPRVKDDRAKKRKRDLGETDAGTKRQRADRRQNKVNGHKSEASVKAAQAESNSGAGALAIAEATGDRELEIVRQFDDGEAGWRVSKPMGGRMLDIDPVLTEDEQ